VLRPHQIGRKPVTFIAAGPSISVILPFPHETLAFFCDLGIRDDSCYAFGGFELWWFDKEHSICRCCRSRWTDLRRQVEAHSLDRAAGLLWRHRAALFLRHKVMSQDRKLQVLSQSCD
jgi:hypothetical protein